MMTIRCVITVVILRMHTFLSSPMIAGDEKHCITQWKTRLRQQLYQVLTQAISDNINFSQIYRPTLVQFVKKAEGQEISLN